MLSQALKIGLVVAVLGVAQDANAFGHGRGWGGCGGGGCGYGYGYGGCGYGGCGYAGYGAGGYGGYYAYGGFAPAFYAGATNGYSSNIARAPARSTVDDAQAVADSAFLTVNVPADAKVIVNGLPTTSTGERRQYTSKGLKPGAVYRYQVRAEFVRDGKPVSEEKTVALAAGKSASLAFAAAPDAKMADMTKSAQR